MNRRYYQLTSSGTEANLNIYGDITSQPMFDTDVSASGLAQDIAKLQNVERINVYINSYGGEVSEGLAIYNALKRHPAKVTTFCDGMACSIASVIFMAGDERIMANPSFLMIHDAWTNVSYANAEELRKQADDLEKITTASVAAYMERVNIPEEKLRELMLAETWLTHDEAIEMGFATAIESADVSKTAGQSAKVKLFEKLLQASKSPSDEDDSEDEESQAEDDETPEKTAEEPETDADDAKPEEPDDDEEEPQERKGKKRTKDEVAQMLCGFFNALKG